MSGTIPSAQAPNIQSNQTLGFTVTGVTPSGVTFAEPAIVDTLPAGEQGTVTPSPSVQGTPNPDGSVPFTTSVTYANTVYTGAYTLDVDLGGVDNFQIEGTIVPVPAEAITGVSGFTVVNDAQAQVLKAGIHTPTLEQAKESLAMAEKTARAGTLRS